MRILIIRHGEPDYSIDSLTKKGWHESDLLSERLAKLKIDAFYVSPLGRAKDTSKATLEKFNKNAVELPWLAEFRGAVPPHGKILSPNPWDFPPQFWTAYDEFYDRNNWTNAPIIREGNSKEIYEETKQGVDALLESHGCIRNGMYFKCEDNRDTTIALFCHFAIGSAIIGYLTGIAPPILWQNFFMPTSSVTTLVSSEVKKGEIGFRCLQFGDTSHLYAANEPLSPMGLMPELYDPDSLWNID